METELRVREKIKAKDVSVGSCFREIQKTRALLVVDLSQVDMFRQPQDDSNVVLREDVVYVVDVATGVVDIVPREQDVYRVTLKATEVD